MKLGFIPLDNVCSVNLFSEVSRLELVSGNAENLYFRLMQRNLPGDQALRYIPVTGASIDVTFLNIDTNKIIERVATNPFPDDRSIWMVPVQSVDKIQVGSMNVTLTEGAVQKKLQAFGDISMLPSGSDQFFC